MFLSVTPIFLTQTPIDANIEVSVKNIGSLMKILGYPMRIVGSLMKRQLGSPMKWGLRWVSDDDDFLLPRQLLEELFKV